MDSAFSRQGSKRDGTPSPRLNLKVLFSLGQQENKSRQDDGQGAFSTRKNVLTQISNGEGKNYLIRALLLIRRVSLMPPFHASTLSARSWVTRGERGWKDG